MPDRLRAQPLGEPYIACLCLARPGRPAHEPVPQLNAAEIQAADGEVPPHVDHVLSKPPKLRELREALARSLDQATTPPVNHLLPWRVLPKLWIPG